MGMKRYVIHYEFRGSECIDAKSKEEAIDEFFNSFVDPDPFGDLEIIEVEQEDEPYDED